VFTHLFQLWLFLATSGLVMYAIFTLIQDQRENRLKDRKLAAQQFADSAVLNAICEGGVYDISPETVKNIEHDLQYLYHMCLSK
jgi:hypothetical protein